MSRVWAFSTAVALLLTACGPDLPDGIETKGEAPLMGYPDTVEVMVFAKADPSAPEGVRIGEPTTVEQAWLEKHGYVYASMRFDSVGTDVLQDVWEDIGEEPNVASVDRLYVRVE